MMAALKALRRLVDEHGAPNRFYAAELSQHGCTLDDARSLARTLANDAAFAKGFRYLLRHRAGAFKDPKSWGAWVFEVGN